MVDPTWIIKCIHPLSWQILPLRARQGSRIASGGALFTICPSPGSELGGDMNCEERVDTLRQLLAVLRRCGEAEAELLAAEARSLISELQQYFFVLHMCSADTRHRPQIT